MQANSLDSLLQLRPEVRPYLALVGVFESYVSLTVLESICLAEDAPEWLRGMSEERWQEMLQPAKAAGLLAPKGKEGFFIEPSFALNFQNLFHEVYTENYYVIYRSLAETYAHRARKFARLQLLGTGQAFDLLRHEEFNLCLATRLAASAGRWAEAADVVRALGALVRQGFVSIDFLMPVDAEEAEELARRAEPLEFWAELQELRYLNASRNKDVPMQREILLGVLPYYRDKKDFVRLADLCCRLGDLLTEDEQPASAEKFYLECIDLNNDHDNHAGKMAALRGLTRIMLQRRDLAQGEGYARQLLHVARRLRDEGQEAEAYRLLGSVALTGKRFQEATKAFQYALQIEDRLGETENLAKTLDSLGEVSTLLKWSDEAFTYLERSQKIWERLGKLEQEAYILDCLGELERKRKNLTAASEYHSRGLRLQARTQNATGTVKSLLRLGKLAMARQETQRAREWFQQASTLAQKYKLSGEQRAKIFEHLGGASCRLGRFAEAKLRFQEALDLWTNAQKPEEIARNYYNQGVVSEHRQEFAEAEYFYSNCEQLCDQEGLSALRLDAVKRLAFISHLGKVPSMFEHWCELWEQLSRFTNTEREMAELKDLIGETCVKRRQLSKAALAYKESLELYLQIKDVEKVMSILERYSQIGASSSATMAKHYEDCLTLVAQEGHPTDILKVLIRLGKLTLSAKDWPNAELYYRKARALAGALEHRDEDAEILNGLGKVLEETGRFKEAEQAYRSADVLGMKLVGLLDVGVTYRFGRKALERKQYEDAALWLQETWHRVKNDVDRMWRGKVACALAELALEQDRLEHADEWLHRSEDAFGGLKLNEEYINMVLVRGLWHEKRKNWWRAARAHQKALKLAENTYKESLIAITVLKCAEFMERHHLPEEAERLYRRAEPIFERLGDMDNLLKAKEGVFRTKKT